MLVNWIDASSNLQYCTFAFLNAETGSIIGSIIQQDALGGKINHSAIAINSDARSVYILTNFPDLAATGLNTLTAMSFSSGQWLKDKQRSFN